MTDIRVANILGELSRLEVIAYQPKTLKPQIVFSVPRIDTKDLHISDQNYKLLKESSLRRRKAMTDYATNSSTCRSQWLLNYFDDPDNAPCGICDVCIDAKHRGTSAEQERTTAETIIDVLSRGRLTIKELSQQLPQIQHDMLTQEVRELLDKGTIHMDDDLRLFAKA